MKPRRLDKLLVERDLARSRARARTLIEEDRVLVDGFPAEKPATRVKPDAPIELRDDGPSWVGRGARKLWPYLEANGLEVDGHVCLDVGSSTGGFTQALLRAGARRVYAVDVGYGQLAYQLREDDRVVVRERCNFRHAHGEDFTPPPSRFTMDVSFISSRKLLPALNRIMTPDGEGVLLLKPQFEAGPDENEEGIVRDPEVQRRVLREVAEEWNRQGWGTVVLKPAPLTGQEGNQEYLLHVRRGLDRTPDSRAIEASTGTAPT